MSKLDDEKWWNFMIYHVYATDEEMEQIMPFVFVLTLVIVLLCAIGIFSAKKKEEANTTNTSPTTATIYLEEPDSHMEQNTK
jgi:hypothetical protein